MTDGSQGLREYQSSPGSFYVTPFAGASEGLDGTKQQPCTRSPCLDAVLFPATAAKHSIISCDRLRPSLLLFFVSSHTLFYANNFSLCPISIQISCYLQGYTKGKSVSPWLGSLVLSPCIEHCLQCTSHWSLLVLRPTLPQRLQMSLSPPSRRPILYQFKDEVEARTSDADGTVDPVPMDCVAL